MSSLYIVGLYSSPSLPVLVLVFLHLIIYLVLGKEKRESICKPPSTSTVQYMSGFPNQPERDLKLKPLRHIKCENEILPRVASLGAEESVRGKV